MDLGGGGGGGCIVASDVNTETDRDILDSSESDDGWEWQDVGSAGWTPVSCWQWCHDHQVNIVVWAYLLFDLNHDQWSKSIPKIPYTTLLVVLDIISSWHIDQLANESLISNLLLWGPPDQQYPTAVLTMVLSIDTCILGLQSYCSTLTWSLQNEEMIKIICWSLLNFYHFYKMHKMWTTVKFCVE